MNMEAPQIILIVMLALSLGISWAQHGKTEMKRNNAWISLISTILLVTILYFGGFWGLK